MSRDPRSSSIAIIGSGPAGLITAYTLLQDGFSQVEILTKDSTAGGVWSTARVYPSLETNNVQGEYSFSAMEMPKAQGEQILGHNLCRYMEAFGNKFKHIIRFNTEVINIRRDETISTWFVTVEDKAKSSREVLEFSRVGCHEPNIPGTLSMDAAKKAGFQGSVIHSKHFASQLDTILEPNHNSIVIAGGGSVAAYLANSGKEVTMVFKTTDGFVASSKPLPEFIRKSRHICHWRASVHHVPTHFSSKSTGTFSTHYAHRLYYNALVLVGAPPRFAFSVRKDSPLRNTHSLFWSIRVTEDGVARSNKFPALVETGNIKVIALTRVHGFGPDGKSVLLDDGRLVKANLVLLATGYRSSWTNVFDEDTAERLGINRHPPGLLSSLDWENYLSLANPPSSRPESDQWASSIYNGIVPAKNIAHRDFAINGAVFTTNAAYTWEVVAHWISSYFLGDKMNIPRTPEEAYKHTERNAAWIRKRYPGTLLSVNESYSAFIPLWT
ncbi:FAD /NAD-P-binding domain-containingprotein [Mycena sanguinolenta]|uniref:FAD /NAD-P-binding domain-containingprotein n=1 Tax=Mycena sanguinolenta TaxID=230812 RepID=A0A8H6XUB0_9AGAR|nr:FAD /NAD-P-binding domain-containingprotein [Mycena sanguinolenta]